MRALRTAALLIALTGASSAYAEAKKETLSAIDAEKLLAFYNELVDHAVKNAADCKALASAVDGVVNRHINTIQMSWAAKKDNKSVPKDVQAKMDARALEMVNALRGCWNDDAVKKQFRRMAVPEEKKK